MSVFRRVSTLLPLVTVLLCGVLTSNLTADIYPTILESSVETDKTIYQLGETVYATHTITNPQDYSVNATFRQSPGFNLLVMQGDTDIWAVYRAFAAVIWTQTFEPGEILELNYTWDMTDNEGDTVLPDEYEIMGVTYGIGQNVSTNITIVPEPATLILLVFGGLGILCSNRRK